jgi:hypothetical protein
LMDELDVVPAGTEWVETWTDAPDAYDGFGTQTVEVVAGWFRGGMGWVPVRKVRSPARHVKWQRMRYASGSYLSADAAWWAEALRHPFSARGPGEKPPP